MSKVKLTQEQANAIEIIKKEHLEHLKKANDEFCYKDIRYWERPLFRLDPQKIYDALYIGYEVEEAFKVGDWVTTKIQKITGIITHISGKSEKIYSIDTSTTKSNSIRHATSKEIAKEKRRRWWHGHGRDVWELLEFDLVDINDRLETVYFVDGGLIHFKSGDTANFEKFTKNGDMKVVCFVEDRKDIGHQ